MNRDRHPSAFLTSTRRAAVALIGIAAVMLTVFASATPKAEAQDISARAERVILDMADRLRPRVAAMRGLEWKRDVRLGVRTKSQVIAMLSRNRESDMAFRRRQAAFLAKLGVVEKGFDLYGQTLRMYSDAVAGFYDSRSKELNLVIRPEVTKDDRVADMMMRSQYGVTQRDCIMAHELTHALDDQYFDLLNVVDPTMVTGDQMLTRTAVIEGTAVSIQYDLLYQRRNLKSYENQEVLTKLETLPGARTDGLPAMLIRQAMWPYTVGNRLVFEARRRETGGWETVNKMFDDLPASTEQVLHPEKYLDWPRDNPVMLDLPDPDSMAYIVGEEQEVLDADTMGEFRLWSYLEDVLMRHPKLKDNARELAITAAAGWDGDVYYATREKAPENGDASDFPVAIVWAFTFDSSADAIEFFEVYRTILGMKYGDKAPAPDPANNANYRFYDSPTTGVALVRRGKDLTVVETVPRSRIFPILEMCFDATRLPWTRPPRGTAVPVENTSPDMTPVETDNYNGAEYTHKEANVTFTMPREGFVLTSEGDSRLIFWDSAVDTHRQIVIRKVDYEADVFPFRFDEYRRAVQVGYGRRAEVSHESVEFSGKPAWHFTFTGRDTWLYDVTVVTTVIQWEGRLCSISVAAPTEDLESAKKDLQAVLGGIKTAVGAGSHE